MLIADDQSMHRRQVRGHPRYRPAPALLPARLALALVLAALGLGGPSGPTAAADGLSFGYLQLAAEPAGRSLGGAHLATVAGPAALAWNPAGLGTDPQPALLLSHATWTAGTAWQWGGACLAMGGGGLGLSCGLFRSGALDGYDSEGNPTGGFSPLQGFVALAHGRPLTSGLRAGLEVELLLETDGTDQEYRSWAGGAGIQLDAGRLHLAGTARHLGPDLKAGGESYPLPATLALAVTLDVARRSRLHAGSAAVGGESPTLRVGAEWGATEALAAYLGAQSTPGESVADLQTSMGLALELGRTRVGYGYQPARHLEASHQLSLTLLFER